MERNTSTSKNREFGVTVLAGTERVFQKILSNSRVMSNNLRGAVCLSGTEIIRAIFSSRLHAELNKSQLSWLIMVTKTTLLHLHLPRRPDNSTNHLNMEPRNARFTSIFNGWEMFQPNLKSNLLQTFSVAIVLLKHVLFLQPGLFFPQPRRIYYLPMTKIILLSIFVFLQ